MSDAGQLNGQAVLTAFAPATTTKTVTRTIVCKLETSHAKNELVRQAIDEFQEMCAYMADMLPSYPEQRWGNRDTTMYRMIRREFPDASVKATIAREAAAKVAEGFASWRENGKRGDRPQYGDGSFIRLSHQDVELVENERGYGLEASFIPYKPVWFHVNAGDYQRERLERVVDGGARAGMAELRLNGGDLFCHLTISREVEVYQLGDVPRYVGVDLGENVLYALAVVGSEGVETAELESGREFRHYRERLKHKRAELQERGDLRGVKAARANYEKYTEQVMDTASRRIVDIASEHAPCCIKLEDLTGYRETAEDPIHDWPHANLREKIMAKATAAAIPVETVSPRETSITCRQCGQTDAAARDGPEFHCRRCGYEVHADVNAAINIASR